MGGEDIALTGKSAQDHHEVSRDGEPFSKTPGPLIST